MCLDDGFGDGESEPPPPGSGLAGKREDWTIGIGCATRMGTLKNIFKGAATTVISQRFCHQLLLRLAANRWGRVVLRIQSLRCAPTRVGQLCQELRAALLRIDVLGRGRDAARSQERPDPVLHPHHILHDHGVRTAELAQCPVLAHLLEHPLLERSRPQLLCQLESILLVALLAPALRDHHHNDLLRVR
jgi:hypothetical protein